MNEKKKGNGVVAKLLFLIDVYEFPLLLQYYLFNKPHNKSPIDISS